MNMDNKGVTLLVLLDLSAAFDTIEHSSLLNILQHDFGVAGTALNWFDSFLSSRKQRILVGDKTSDDFNLNCGVPQGSCKGPVLFTLHVYSLFNIISQHLPSVNGYDDDTQTYFSFRPFRLHFQLLAPVNNLKKQLLNLLPSGTPLKSVRNLWSWFDAHVRMNVHNRQYL